MVYEAWTLEFQSLNTIPVMVRGLPQVGDCKDVCEGCALGKKSRRKFPKEETWRAKNPLKLVYIDIFGPMQTQYFGKSSYFVTFIEDFTRCVGFIS